MKNKALIFGGIALVVGVGAYMWYKKSLKTIADTAKAEIDQLTKKPEASYKTFDKQKLALALSTNQIATAFDRESTNRGGVMFGSNTASSSMNERAI